MRTQVILNAPSRVLVGRYITKSIQKRVDIKQISKREALKRWGKNRYRPNPDSKPFRSASTLMGNGLGKMKIIEHVDANMHGDLSYVPITKMHKARVERSIVIPQVKSDEEE